MFQPIKEPFVITAHRLLYVKRVLFRVPSDAYLKKLSEKNDRLKPVLNDNGEPINCRTCGFARARMIFDNGWEMEGCTATGFKGLIDDAKLERWVANMPRERVTSDIR